MQHKGETAMKTYFHLASKEAKIIIEHKNNLKSNYAISNLTGISKGKIKRCLEKAKYEKSASPMFNNLEKVFMSTMDIHTKNEKKTNF